VGPRTGRLSAENSASSRDSMPGPSVPQQVALPSELSRPTLFLRNLNKYRAVNTLRLGCKTNQLILYSEKIAVCSQIHTKHINTLCGQNVGFFNIKPGGI
jgi:hypothetical protein